MESFAKIFIFIFIKVCELPVHSMSLECTNHSPPLRRKEIPFESDSQWPLTKRS